MGLQNGGREVGLTDVSIEGFHDHEQLSHGGVDAWARHGMLSVSNGKLGSVAISALVMPIPQAADISPLEGPGWGALRSCLLPPLPHQAQLVEHIPHQLFLFISSCSIKATPHTTR